MGQSEEAARLDALLGQWPTAGIALRRRLAQRLRAERDAMDPGSIPAETRARLSDLGVRDERDGRDIPVNAVFVPLVGEAEETIVAAIQVHEDARHESALQSKLDVESHRAADHAVRAAAAMAERRLVTWTFDFVTERRGERVEAITGRSLALGVFLSALSLFTGRRVLPGTVASADLVDGVPRGVGQWQAKLSGLVGRSDLARVVVAKEDAGVATRVAASLGLEAEIVGVSTLREAAEAALGESILVGAPLESKIERARQTYGDGWGPRGWVLVEQAVTPLLAAIPLERPELRVELMTMLAAARRNAGDSAGALDLLDLAALSFEGDRRWIEKRVLAFYHRQRALTLLDQGLVEEALIEADASMRAAEAAGRRGDYAVALGTAALVRLGAGEPRAALEAVDEALATLAAWDPRSLPRTQAYRVLTLATLGRLDEAEAILGDASRAGGEPYARRAEAWMRTYLAGALLTRGHPRRALDVLSVKVIAEALRGESDLSPLARLYCGEALSALDEPALAEQTFERVPVETGVRTPFQDRRVALTQLRRARLLSLRGAHAAAEACVAQALPPLALSGEEELGALREEVLSGREGDAIADVATRCVRAWEPLALGVGAR